MTDASGELPLDRRMAVFLALVDVQDKQLDVFHSRRLIAKRYGIEETEVRRIEEEGLRENWPPLNAEEIIA